MLKNCMQVITDKVAACNGADGVYQLFDLAHQMDEDESLLESFAKSKLAKSEWASLGNSIVKLGNDNLTVARIEASEKEKDRVAAEMTFTFDKCSGRKTVFFNTSSHWSGTSHNYARTKGPISAR